MNIISASNRQETLLRKLNRKKYRQKEQLFLIEGARAVEQVLANESVEVQTLFFDEDQQYWQQRSWQQVADDIQIRSLSGDLFAEFSDTDTPQGVLALCQIPNEATVSELVSQKGTIVALDAVQDPGNLGTIIRTATWFGACGIISGKGTVDLFHPKVVRATAGATGSLPFMNGKLEEILPAFEQEGWPIYFLDAGEDAMDLAAIPSQERAVLVVGNEAHGIRTGLMNGRGTKVRISSPGGNPNVESLNAAVATSIVLYGFSDKLH